MLSIIIPGDEYFDDETETFFTVNDTTLQLEHSLVSLSKWESKYQKPFLNSEDKTSEEIIYYIEAMVLNDDFSPKILKNLSRENISSINDYMESSRSATTFRDSNKPNRRGETITSELIYYWMVAFNIPFECQYWHLNRLFTLVKICNVKNEPPSKMSKQELAQRNRELNEQRKKENNTNG